MDKQGGEKRMNKPIVALFYGWTVVLAIILLTSICLALILRFTELNEPTLSTITLVLGLIGLFVGGFVAGIKSKAKGWITGGAIGIGFSLFIFLIQYLGYEQTFTFSQSLHHLGFLIAALIGGIIGVNFVSQQD